MTEKHYDVCVIGGGIHGVGVAQRAAAQGYSVLLLEKTALAAGTSSRSSKLIHGGLRYLESTQLSLVRECLRERALLLRIAPDLVRLQPFMVPVFLNTRRRPWQLWAGLSLYALLGGLKPANRFTRVLRRDWEQLDGLSTVDLVDVFRYWDAQTDDALLTRAVMHSAQDLGAELAMPAELIQATVDGYGCTVDYVCAGRSQTCRATALVNAAGPWIGDVAKRISPSLPLPRVDLVQGAHVEVGGVLTQGIYYMEAPQDGRAVFALPWQGHTLVGTTETPFTGDPATVAPLPQEKDYLLETLCHYFPRYREPQQGAVMSSFAGLRVLPAGSGGAFNRSRETVLVVDDPGRPRVLAIVGGKLTAYRATADKVMERLAPRLPQRLPRADTKTLPLTAP